MTRFLYFVEDFFGHLRLHWMWWPALGGLVVGVGGLLQPRALGVGYDVIGDLLQHRMLVSAALSLLLVKAFIWVIALGSGTSGGVLAPLLMIGAGLGSVLGGWLPGGSPQLLAVPRNSVRDHLVGSRGRQRQNDRHRFTTATSLARISNYTAVQRASAASKMDSSPPPGVGTSR
jgi:Voltage gated chloride channel